MKKLLVLFAALSLASFAFAGNQMMSDDGGAVDIDHSRDMFYCQNPYAMAGNSSTDFGAEDADDIPDDLIGMQFNTVGGWLLMWGGYWTNPQGVYVNIYNAECPPTYDPAQSYFIAWGDMAYTEYVNMNGYDTYYFEALLPDTWTVVADMSIGLAAQLGWGQNPPYAGFCLTNYEVFGCGEMHWAGDYWGYPRWTPFGQYGYYMDLAYCLGGGTTATPSSDFSTVKALY